MSWSISNAMLKDYANSRSLLAQEAGFLVDCCLDGELSALLNTTPMPDQFYWPDKTTEHSRLSRFGMTCEPLTESLGSVLLTWFLEDSLARTYQQQEEVPELKAKQADSGEKWQGSFAKFSRDLSLWKTAQYSLLGDSEEFLETWPRWGSMRNGESYLQPILARNICESASGLWPTQNVCGGGNTGPLTMKENHFTRKSGKKAHLGLDQAVKIYATPIARDSRTVRGGQRSMNSIGSEPLITQVAEMECLKDGRLNPEWVEWLMGWPAQWTGLQPLEMVKFQEWQQQHSLSYPNDLNKESA